MSFTDVIREILDGKMASRTEWNDKRHYIILGDYILQLHKAGESNETLHPWIISESDLVAEDWIVV